MKAEDQTFLRSLCSGIYVWAIPIAWRLALALTMAMVPAKMLFVLAAVGVIAAYTHWVVHKKKG